MPRSAARRSLTRATLARSRKDSTSTASSVGNRSRESFFRMTSAECRAHRGLLRCCRLLRPQDGSDLLGGDAKVGDHEPHETRLGFLDLPIEI